MLAPTVMTVFPSAFVLPSVSVSAAQAAKELAMESTVAVAIIFFVTFFIFVISLVNESFNNVFFVLLLGIKKPGWRSFTPGHMAYVL